MRKPQTHLLFPFQVVPSLVAQLQFKWQESLRHGSRSVLINNGQQEIALCEHSEEDRAGRDVSCEGVGIDPWCLINLILKRSIKEPSRGCHTWPDKVWSKPRRRRQGLLCSHPSCSWRTCGLLSLFRLLLLRVSVPSRHRLPYRSHSFAWPLLVLPLSCWLFRLFSLISLLLLIPSIFRQTLYLQSWLL